MFKNLNPAALGVSGHQSEIIEWALTNRFQGIELDIEEFSGRVHQYGLPYSRRLVDSARLRLGVFRPHLEWDADDESFRRELPKLAEMAKLAAEVGCTRAVAVVAPTSDKRPYHENFEFHRQRFADICRALQPAGVRLGVGFRADESLHKAGSYQFIHDPDALALLVSMVGVDNVGLVLDVWELFVAGKTAEYVRGLNASQIVDVRLADLPAEDVPLGQVTESMRHLPGTSGKVDCVAVLKILSELGYDGPVTLAPDRSTLSGLRRDAVVAQAGRVMNQIWEDAGLAAARRPVVRSMA